MSVKKRTIGIAGRLCAVILAMIMAFVLPVSTVGVSAASTSKTQAAAKKKYKKKLKSIAKSHDPKNYNNGWLTGEQVMRDQSLSEAGYWERYPIHYSYVDIDKDGVSELAVLVREPWVDYSDGPSDGKLYIYRYTGSKVKQVFEMEFGTNSVFNKSTAKQALVFYENAMSLRVEWESEWVDYYKYSSKGFSHIAGKEDFDGKLHYYITKSGAGTEVTKKEYESVLGKNIDTGKKIKVKWKLYK